MLWLHKFQSAVQRNTNELHVWHSALGHCCGASSNLHLARQSGMLPPPAWARAQRRPWRRLDVCTSAWKEGCGVWRLCVASPMVGFKAMRPFCFTTFVKWASLEHRTARQDANCQADWTQIIELELEALTAVSGVQTCNMLPHAGCSKFPQKTSC